MAEVTFSCPQCRQTIRCDVLNAGSEIACPNCQKPVVVVLANPAPAAPQVVQIKTSTLKMVGTVAAAIVLLAVAVWGGWFLYTLNSFPRLGGDWKMGGPYNAGKPCQIVQHGKELTFINENGGESSGEFKDSKTVVALDWEGGLIGKLNQNVTRINWRNGTWWIREK